MRSILSLSLLFVFTLALVSCGPPVPEEEDEPTLDEVTPADGGDMADSARIVLEPMPNTADFPDAAIKGVTYTNGNFAFNVANYELGVQTPDADQLMCANSGQGQHIHLIVDNAPYIAKYEAKFENTLPDGEHYLMSFLSRSYHLSLKQPAAAWYRKVNVTGGKWSESKIEKPMVFYSRPKGEYVGKKEVENVILDFYPINAELGDDYMVLASINGQEFLLNDWRPYYIKGLPMGDNTVSLTLVNADRTPVDSPLNPVTRTFTLKGLPTGE
ncbi:MAG: hypothetical protein WBA17_09140 [Saprospiraceae bacterium]